MMGAVAQSWVPYVAVPFAMGFVVFPSAVVRAGLVGALSSLTLVVAFYVTGNPERTGAYSVDADSIYSEYGPLSLVTGFMLAGLSRCMARRAAAAPGRWALACCSFLTLALVASWMLLGWGAHEVATSSGVVTIGASTVDVVASSAIVLTFACAVIMFAIYSLPKPSQLTLPGKLGQSESEQPRSN